MMVHKTLKIEYMPELTDPLFIAGFDGWGNALDVSRGMMDYLVRKLEARPFAKLDPDPYYRFDENRPLVDIENGLIRKLTPPGGAFFMADRVLAGRDIILFNGAEPSLGWGLFVETTLSLCRELGVGTIIGLGSMYDNVLHTDMIVSALASSEEILSSLEGLKVSKVTYKGPSAIHSTLLSAAKQKGFRSMSLWGHCPYYLQGTTHFGLISHLGSILTQLEDFDLDRDELDSAWKEVSKQIQMIIEKNPELRDMISDLRKAKVKGSWGAARKQDKIIHLEDFMKPV